MKVLCRLLLSGCLFMSPAGWAEIAPGAVQSGSLARQDSSEARYYILHQQAEPTRKLLVLMQGSDCNSAKNNRFMVDTFGGAFADHDILLVEKYGITDALAYDNSEDVREDCPPETMFNDTLSVRVSDYTAILNRLKGDYDSVVVLGGSEGATVAEHVGLASPVVSAVVAVNGGGRCFLDDVTYSFRRGPAPLTENDITDFVEFTDAVKKNEVPGDLLVSQHGVRWWREFLMVDTQQVLNDQKKPVLVIQTLNDTNVNVPSFKQMQKEVVNPQVAFKTFDNLDHYFKDAQGQRQTTQILMTIRDWYDGQDLE